MRCAVERILRGFSPSFRDASSVRLTRGRWALVALAIVPLQPAAAQDALRPGEAYVTRFSGVAASGSGDNQTFTINTEGTVGSIIDIRAPGEPPQGRHWINEPQRLPVTAGEVGQVFGVALDDANPPNVYLTATSAFGLHRTPNGQQWMPGMWGPGGPGAVYKLDAANGYRPRPFATVALDGRPNSGPALGNIAFDRWNKQFFVSDLETGMIHRIGINGADGGHFDHGTQGRANFTDARTRRPGSLPPIPFDPGSRARIADCPAQPFDNAPECWNFAPSNRRVWGLGVRSDAPGKVRLYYAVWSGPDFDPNAWNSGSDEDKRNSIWSVGLGPDGAFVPSEVRREFVLPDFFVTQEDIGRSGYSHPASDISFPTCSNRPIMLVAERGSIRNLGLASENAFAYPHESRALRYELDQTGAWRPVGRYDVGFYDRRKDGPPFIHANCAGGIAFGPGYSQQGRADPAETDQFVWITGDSLCSPDGPCNAAPDQAGPQAAPQPGGQPPAQPASQQTGGQQGDDSEVHGIQGMRADAIAELAPATAFPKGQQNENVPVNVVGVNESYLIDTDINVDAQGNPIADEFTRNDATLVGDIAIYQVCAQAQAEPPVELLPPPPDDPPPPIWVGHPLEISHAEYSSHGRELSHYRWGSHYPVLSHGRWRSHYRYWSHNWILSGWHNPYWSHWPRLSHYTYRSIRHDVFLSPRHNVFLSPRHIRILSPRHDQFLSPRHLLPLSPGHNRLLSPIHRLPLSPYHATAISPGHRQPLSPYHNLRLSPSTTHSARLSPITVHRPPLSPGHNPNLSPGHRLPLSPAVVHNRVLSPQTSKPTHDAVQSRVHDPVRSRTTTHDPVQSRVHDPVRSRTTTHDPVRSRTTTHVPAGSHNAALSRRGAKPVHTAVQSRGTTHSTAASRGTTHSTAASRGTTHSTAASRGRVHSAAASRGTTTHSATLSRGGGATTHSAALSRRGGATTHNATVSRGTTTTRGTTVRQPTKKCLPGQLQC